MSRTRTTLYVAYGYYKLNIIINLSSHTNLLSELGFWSLNEEIFQVQKSGPFLNKLNFGTFSEIHDRFHFKLESIIKLYLLHTSSELFELLK